VLQSSWWLFMLPDEQAASICLASVSRELPLTFSFGRPRPLLSFLDCAAENSIKIGEPIRCRECGQCVTTLDASIAYRGLIVAPLSCRSSPRSPCLASRQSCHVQASDEAKSVTATLTSLSSTAHHADSLTFCHTVLPSGPSLG
jgi:hypothetical protein